MNKSRLDEMSLTARPASGGAQEAAADQLESLGLSRATIDPDVQQLAQKHNLYAAQPDKVRELSTLLEHVRAKGQVR